MSEIYLGVDIVTLSHILTQYGKHIGAVKENEVLNVIDLEVQEEEDLAVFLCELSRKELN